MTVIPVHFQDLGLKHKLVTYAPPDGPAVTKWIPYGMPQLDNEVLRSTFYLYRKNPKTGKIEGPKGTGVFVGRRPEDPIQHIHIYAVTSHHVAISSGASIIRVNTWGGTPPKLGYRFLKYQLEEWSFIPNSDDIAAIDVTNDLGHQTGENYVRCIWEDDFVTKSFASSVILGPGEDGFMLGLFTKSPGEKYNMPTTRFGNIAQLANEDHWIEQANGVKRPSHIFDIHSRPGFSGSPVFIYRTPSNSLENINFSPNWNIVTKDNLFLRLLGIHSGQFTDRVEARVAESYGDIPIKEGDNLDIPSSMTIVAPAWAISQLLDTPELTEQRRMRERKNARNGEPSVRPEAEEVARSVEAETPTDESPTHREDFMRLQGVAARKQPRDD